MGRMKIKSHGVLVLLVCGLCFTLQLFPANSNAFASDWILVANKGIVEGALSNSDVKKIFLGKKKMWGNDQKILLAIPKEDDMFKNFVKTYTKKSPGQFKNYWKNMLFTGKGEMPKTFSNDKELVEYIQATKGAIGFVSSSAGSENVKTISIKE